MSPRRRGRGRRGGPPGPDANPAGVPQVVEAELPAAPAVADRPPRVTAPPAPRPRAAAVPRAVVAPRPPVPIRIADADLDADLDDDPPPLDHADRRPSCTLAQMRRFIKSRPYVPLHELRRRFEIGGIEDEVSRVATSQGVLFVGLPNAEAGYLGELVSSGEVGCELLLDPTGPAVIGVYPMRPVARQ